MNWLMEKEGGRVDGWWSEGRMDLGVKCEREEGSGLDRWVIGLRERRV